MSHSSSTDAHHGHDDGHGDQVGHIVPIGLLVGVGAALLALTVVTVAVRWIDLGEANIVVALAIAAVKATLVALFFMHLWWDRPFNGFTFVGSIIFVALFMGFALMDVHAYRPELNTGLAPGAKDTLQAADPEAPLLKKTEALVP